MKTIQTNIFEFSELSDSAKERARQWFRNSSDDCFWSESVIDDAADLFDLIGVDIRQTLKTPPNGKYYYAPSVFFSGFSSQGDGACFNAKYRYKKGGLKALIAHAPNETALHEIAKQMQDIQKRYFYAIQASTSHNSWGYSHAYMMNIDVECENGIGEDAENDISECLRDLANWLYRAAFMQMARGGNHDLFLTQSGVTLDRAFEHPVIAVRDVQCMTEDTMILKLSAFVRGIK